MGERLQLRAEDAEDLAVISSCLQDALVPLADMRYDRAAREFIVAVNRFRWEACEAALPDDAVFERIACAVTFKDVRAVNLRGIDQSRRGRPLELLAVMVGEPEKIAGAIVLLVFAGGGRIRLELERISCTLRDFGEPWPTRWQPRHLVEQR
jgi:hypothetical protein